MAKRYEVEVSKPRHNTESYEREYRIRDNSRDTVICACDASEDAELIVKAMNKLTKQEKENKI